MSENNKTCFIYFVDLCSYIIQNVEQRSNPKKSSFLKLDIVNSVVF